MPRCARKNVVTKKGGFFHVLNRINEVNIELALSRMGVEGGPIEYDCIGIDNTQQAELGRAKGVLADYRFSKHRERWPGPRSSRTSDSPSLPFGASGPG